MIGSLDAKQVAFKKHVAFGNYRQKLSKQSSLVKMAKFWPQMAKFWSSQNFPGIQSIFFSKKNIRITFISNKSA